VSALRHVRASGRTVSSRNLIHPLLDRGDHALDRALLELHSVQEMKEFWRTSRRVLHEALPLHFICLCMRPFVLMPSTVFREKAPFASEAEFKLFQELSPLAGFLAARPGTTLVRMSDVVSDSELAATEFYRRFMQPHQDRFFACFCFWHAGTFQGMIGLHRTAAQRDFTDTDMAFLARLHPHFETVFQRILNLHRERAVRLSLERLLGHLPIATVLLDWDLRVIYRNRSAVDLCARWNFGATRARLEKHTDDFRLPTPVLDYCESFKANWNPCLHRLCALTTPAGGSVHSAREPGLRATVNLLQLDAAPLSMPIFLVRFDQPVAGNGAGDGYPDGEHLSRLASLSPREREVALLAGEGCGNDEIARRLGKSVLTVKKQLRSIYAKLEVANRGRLIALLR
jgi:DNA-binding CsgD family transcriptional regulator